MMWFSGKIVGNQYISSVSIFWIATNDNFRVKIHIFGHPFWFQLPESFPKVGSGEDVPGTGSPRRSDIGGGDACRTSKDGRLVQLFMLKYFENPCEIEGIHMVFPWIFWEKTHTSRPMSCMKIVLVTSTIKPPTWGWNGDIAINRRVEPAKMTWVSWAIAMGEVFQKNFSESVSTRF